MSSCGPYKNQRSIQNRHFLAGNTCITSKMSSSCH
jgi:hypothetical protein